VVVAHLSPAACTLAHNSCAGVDVPRPGFAVLPN